MSKVMLVEDDNNLREIYEARLKAEGYDIVSAKDGEEALAIAKAQMPDLIISDVMMPKISGFEMLDILRNTDGLKEVKVIMLTALGQSDDQQRADKLGADRYLVKSQVTLEDIVSVAHELLKDNAAAPATDGTPAVASATAPAPAPTESVTNQAIPVAAAPSAPADPIATPPSTPATPAEPTTPTPDPAPAAEPKAPSTDVTSFTAGATDPEPKPADPATPAATTNVAASTAQEEADVEAKIEDFVAGATTDAAAPSSAAIVSTVPADVPTPEPTPEEAAANTATDDKLMADAVDTLVSDSSTKSDDATSKTDTTVLTPTSAPEAPAEAETPETPADTEDAPTVPESKPTDSGAGSVPIAHKKVITPITDGEPKKDINTLLALEEAKEAGSAAPAKPTAVIDTGAGAQPTPLATPAPTAATDFAASKQADTTPEQKPDPNSIAL